jgi:hypothetical protein
MPAEGERDTQVRNLNVGLLGIDVAIGDVDRVPEIVILVIHLNGRFGN